MAVSPEVPSASQKIRIKDVQNNRPNSESVNSKIAGSVNFLLDRSFFQIKIQHDGYFSDSQLFKSAPIRIPNIADITYYQMGLVDSGSANQSVFNFEVYDAAGAFVNNLFGTGANAISVSGSSGANIVLGRDVVNATTFDTNTAGHTIQYGNLNLTTLQAGYILVPFVEDFATNARSINFVMRIQEQ